MTDDSPRDEGQLLLAHSQGEAGAFAELVSAYRAPVYSYLHRCGVDGEERDDLFQDIFLKIHRAAGSYEPARPLHPWIFTIVANTVRNHQRRGRVRRMLFAAPVRLSRLAADEGDPLPDLEPVDPGPDGESVAAAKETAAWLSQRIRRLPEGQRQVLLLAGVEGLSLQKVAAALKIPLNTVKSRLSRARTALGEALARRQAAAPTAGHLEAS